MPLNTDNPWLLPGRPPFIDTNDEAAWINPTAGNDEPRPFKAATSARVLIGGGADEVLPALTLSLTGGSATEGGNLDFIWTLNRAADRDYVINFSTLDVTATNGADYSGYTAADYTIRSGQTIGSMTFATLSDSADESNETLSLVINSAPGISLLNSSATGTIVDNNPTTLTLIGGSVDEGGNLDFIWSLSRAADQDYTINFSTTGGSATFGSDYSGYSNENYVIRAGQQIGSLTIVTQSDALVEGDETLSLAINAATGLSLVNSSATGTIRDVAVENPLQLAITGGRVDEGGKLDFTWTLNGSADRDYTINFSTVDVTTTLGVDYTGFVNTDYIIHAGQSIGSFTFDTTDDSVSELEETFSLVINDADGLGVLNASSTGTIVDNDLIGLTLIGGRVDEGGTLDFIWSLDRVADQDYTINFSTTGGSAVNGADYSGYINTDYTIRAGQQIGSLSIATLEDALAEGDETFSLVLNAATGLRLVNASAEGTIVDVVSENPLQLSLIGGSTEEGGKLDFTWTLNQAADTDYTINFSTLDVTATNGVDYAGDTNANYVIHAGQSIGSLTFNTTDDAVSELSETLTLVINDGGGLQLLNATATGTLIDNDPITLSLTGGSIVEGGTVDFIWSLDRAADQDYTISFSTVAGTASDSADYGGYGNTDYTIRAGQQIGSLSIVTVNDGTVEGDESFTLAIHSGGGLALANSSANGTIVDDDQLQLTLTGGSANEGSNIDFIWSLNGVADRDYVLNFSTVDVSASDGADYAGYINAAYTIHAGTSSGSFTFATLGDSAAEGNETFSLVINDADGLVMSSNSATGTIIDQAPEARVLTFSDAMVLEGAQARVHWTLDSAIDSAMTVDLNLTDGLTLGGSDYSAISSFTIDANTTRGSFFITTLDDALSEGTESLNVVGTNTSRGGVTLTAASATVSIVDDDNGPVPTYGDVTNFDLSGIHHIDALLEDGPGWNFKLPATNTLYYTFSVTSGTQSGVVASATNSAQQSAIRDVLAHASEVTGITFTETSDGTAADIHFALERLTGLTAGYTSWQSSYNYRTFHLTDATELTEYDPEAWVYLTNNTNQWFYSAVTNPVAGNVGYEVILHEFGHVLGLKHPFESTSGNTETLTTVEDNTANTLMSYTDAPGASYFSTYQPYDVAALNYIYGTDGLGDAWGSGELGDFLTGLADNVDVLSGTSGPDVLWGAGGGDTLTGGDSTDIFQIADTDTGIVTITDFEPGIDVIEYLDSATAGSLTTGTRPTDHATFVYTGETVSASVDTFIYDPSTGSLSLDLASDSAGAAQIALLSNRPALFGGDILVTTSS